MGGYVERSRNFATLGIESIQPVAGREPDLIAVEGDAGHVIDIWKGPIFSDDFGS
jgi:hypothetical protein